MAAPSGIVWGSVVGSYGRIGVYVSLSNTNTQTTASVEVWFWSKYSVEDSNNTLYFDNRASSGSATTSRGSVSINTTVATGDGWSTTNQKKIASYSYNYTRAKSNVTRYLYAALDSVDIVGGKMYASTTFSVPKLASYTVTYNANGGSGAPSSQTKWYGQTLTLSTTKPTRTGYSFQGWGTSASDTSVDYAAGANYTANSGATLCAIWKANTYTIKFNANGGTGAPANQTKTYGVTLKLSTTKPTRTNYNFLGWSTSATATSATYTAGGNYTKNSGATLYAVWQLAYVKPRINNYTLSRCDSAGAYMDDGTYVNVSFSWECDQDVSELTLELEDSSGNVISTTFEGSGTSGTVKAITADGGLNAESTYTARLTVRDATDYTTIISSLGGAKFAADFKAGGTGVAFGKAAELDNVCDIAFQTRFYGGLLYVVLEPETDLNTVLTPNFYIGANISTYKYANCPLTSGTFTMEVVSCGEAGQVKQSITTCQKTAARTFERFYYSSGWGEWVCTSDFGGTLLWSGGYYMTASHTITLSEPVSKQRSGIVLVFSRYSSGTAQNYHFNTFFIPKYQIAAHGGCGHTFMLTNDGTFGLFAAKYLYLHDTQIVGNDVNSATDTGACGITYTNNAFVLRYVIGV